MRIYVAGSIHEADRARAFADTLVSYGHEITHRWFDGNCEGDQYLTDADRYANFHWCSLGVRTAELVILLVSEPHAQRGSHTEWGIAIGAGIPRILVASPELRKRCTMYWDSVSRVYDTE